MTQQDFSRPSSPFVHRSVVYASSRHCADVVAARARTALQRGGPVLVLVEPPVEAVVRERLGAAATAIGFRPQSWLIGMAPAEIVESARADAEDRARLGRVTVLAQQPRHDGGDDDFWLAAECTANASLAARTVDLTCLVDEGGTARNLEVARMTHPVVVRDDRDIANPDYVPPEIVLLRESGAGVPHVGPPADQHIVDPHDPAPARAWLRAKARELPLPEDVTDEFLTVAGEAVMTSWEAEQRIVAVPDEPQPVPWSVTDALGGMRVLLWRTSDEVVCDVLAPAHFGSFAADVPPRDLRLRWLWMASLISPSVRLAIYDRPSGIGSCIRLRVSGLA